MNKDQLAVGFQWPPDPQCKEVVGPIAIQDLHTSAID